MRHVRRTTIAILTFGSFVVTGSVGTQGQQPRTVASGVYTADQAKRGEAAYEKSCSVCHLPDLTGDQFATPLIGETFAQRWKDSNVGELFTVVKGTMPATAPGALTDEIYADIVAFLLMMNKYPAGGQELGKDPQELGTITFGNQ